MHVTESMYPVLKGTRGIMEAREELCRENGVESPAVQGGDIFIKSRERFHPLLTEHQIKRALKDGNGSPHHSIAKKMPVQQEPGREREGTGLSAAGVNAAGEPGKILKSSDEINQKILEAMADPEAFMRELNITRLLNVDRNAEDLSRDTKQWLRRTKWRKDLREGKMPDLTQYPEGDAVPGKTFMKGYFETVIKPSKTPEMIRDMLRDEENAMLDWFIPLVRDEMEKACRPGASISDEADWSIRREQYPEISALVEKNTDDREVREKLLGTYEKKLKRAFKLATAIVRPDNLAFNMYRAESPSALASDPYLYSHITRHTEGVVRNSIGNYKALTGDIFQLLGEQKVPEPPRGDYYPKYASLTFKSLPPGIEAERPYQGNSRQFLPPIPYTMEYEQIVGRALYYVGDAGMSFWGGFEDGVSAQLYNDRPEDFNAKHAVLTESIKPLSDLSNLFEHVLRELVDKGNKIRMPGPAGEKETIEVIIMGQMKYKEDFQC